MSSIPVCVYAHKINEILHDIKEELFCICMCTVLLKFNVLASAFQSKLHSFLPKNFILNVVYFFKTKSDEY
jgi:hypothetical protein